MLKIAIPHQVYSENKVKLKNVIKKFGMSWESGKNGWINGATGDGVYIDKSVMDMILSDSFTGDMPMTMFVDSGSKEFISEFSEKIRALGGSIVEDATPGAIESEPAAAMPDLARKERPPAMGQRSIFVRLNTRDAEGCMTREFAEKAAEDLKEISRRWERRRAQVLLECRRAGMEKDATDRFLHREEIAFRKDNACWITGEFPSEQAENGEDG
jgi:hypothetical protein